MNGELRNKVALNLIKSEGIVLHAYQDSEGWWTIGVGHLIDKRKGGAIPARFAYELLDYDIEKAHGQVVGAFPWFPEQDIVRQAVLVELAFNLGLESLKGFKNTLAAFRMKDYPKAAQGLKKSKWFTQVQASRSSRIINMTLTGEWAA